jgi:hypothetical protein
VYLLGASGVPPRDTTVELKTGQPRIVVLRHGPPDNLTFAELAFPAEAFGPGAGDSVRVTIHPRPGLYGLDLASAAPFTAVQLTFKYAVHFSAPEAARRQFGADEAFERVLAIGRVEPGDQIVFLVSTRPAPDNLQTTLPGPGTYLVGAPK